MDAKSLAKSKRSHSQHLSKRHNPRQASKATSSSAAGAINTKKTPEKQVKEKPHSLPANWDRYEEEFDSGSEDTLNRPSDVVVPKSKGADFGYLISQAQTEYSSDRFASLEDLLPEFHQGVGAMLSVRGQSILSWTADDNFIVEDKATPSVEAPFLSMNLHALAEQLAKVDLPQRLFIEADLLPPELRDEGSKESSNEKHALKAAKQTTVKSDSRGSVNAEKITELYIETTSSGSGGRHHISILSNQTPVALDSFKDEKKQLEGSKAQFKVNSDFAVPTQKPSIFKADTTEAELDMLLDSFSETKLLDSYEFPTSRNESLILQSMDPQLLKKGADLSKVTSINAGFDDALDELLGDVPNLMNRLDGESRLPQEINIQSSSSSIGNSKNLKVMDDFDSWLDTI